MADHCDGKGLLIHICCAPCAIHPLDVLRRQGMKLKGFFYNPNIHPFMEYKRRLDALRGYAAKEALDLHIEDSYDLEGFLGKVLERPEFGKRCALCYEMRLRQAARYAREQGFDLYSTTLLSSPYQFHDLIKEMGQRIGEEEGVEFFYHDFREGFREGQNKAKELGIYRQPYCGCIFSERDRYRKQKLR
ncbi:MAG TPA: epoxyqueuosine reductase QueH [Clostridia bacterium]|nr:epoxyqueuosine reductase QueH [Clostridia bacterium]